MNDILDPEEECRHGLMLGTCTICKARVIKTPPETTMAARHDSRCPTCGGVIEQGDLIGLADMWWICERCFT